MIDNIEHRGFFVPLYLRMNNRYDIDYNSLARKVFVYQVSLNQYLSSRWLSSARHVFRNFLDLNPLVIHHSRDIHDEVESGPTSAAC